MAISRDFTAGSIPRHFRNMAIPTAIGIIFVTLYNVVDSFFAGLLSTDALAGLAISFQIFFLLIAVGFGVNAAMAALVGREIGAGRQRHAKRMACQGISYAIIASVLLTLLGYLIGPAMIRAVSEPGTFRDTATAYLSVLFLATPGFLVAFAANGILMAQGDAVSMTRAQIASFFANVALNPLLIFGIPGFIDGIGFNGIAISTTMIQTSVMAYILWRVATSDLMKRKDPPVFQPRSREFREITKLAFPTSSAMIVMMIGSFVVQLYLKPFGPEAIAAYGVGLRIEQMLLLPAFGLTASLLPIASQNLGASEFDRVRESFAFCCKVGFCLMLIGSMFLWFAARPAMAIFTDDPEVIRLGGNYLNVDGFILPVYILLFAMNSLLQAFKRPIFTLWIGIFRQGIGIAVFVGLYVVVFGMDSWGVWLGIATSVIAGFFLALVITSRVADKEIGGLFRSKRA